MEKNWKKRWMAGAMAFALCCTTLLQTGASAVSAAEVGGVSAQSETQIEVQTETQTETQSVSETQSVTQTQKGSQIQSTSQMETGTARDNDATAGTRQDSTAGGSESRADTDKPAETKGDISGY